MSNHYQFARNLVKGKIAETIFAQMLRESHAYIVLEFGYEKIIPQLADHDVVDHEMVMETLRCAPDFAVIDKEKKTVHLIEVKYREQLDQDEIFQHAKRMHAAWNPSFMFIATLDGFLFDSVENIVANHGQVAPFYDTNISATQQEKYLAMLRDFEAGETRL